MKITNVTAYSIFAGAPLPTLEALEAALSGQQFEPCGPSQEKSFGFAPPREANGAMVESVAGQWVGKLCIETRSVPASEVRRAIDKRVADIEKSTGRKPGKKERKELKEDITLELLPRAFSKIAKVGFWIDPDRRTLVIDTPSAARADIVATALVKAAESMALALINTTQLPDVAMAGWLGTREAPAGFTIDRDCELKAPDESRAVVKYTNHPLDTDEVIEHIRAGMRPTQLAMTFDDRISFVLTAGGTIRSITYLEGIGDADGKAADNFDADVTLATGELRALMTAMTEALGGIAQMEIGQGADQQGVPADPRVGGVGGETDPAYEQALGIVREHGKASISLVQRVLKIGYNRAARLIEDMEKAGAVSAANSSGVRTVLA
jgi:recombination associated protein RdgC